MVVKIATYKKRGQSADVITTTLDHLEVTAPPLLFPVEDHPDYQTTAVSTDLSCLTCSDVLERPLQLACGDIFCYNCCQTWIYSCPTSPTPCPCCHDHHLGRTTIRSSLPVVVSLLSSLLVICSRGCGRLVRADQYIKHVDSKCEGYYHLQVNSPSKITLRDVLSKPTQTPPTPAEKQAAEHLV